MQLTPRSRSADPLFECLESRRLLAGTVTVAVIGGELVVTGDALANQFSVFQGVPGSDTFVVSGVVGTTISPAGPFTGVTKGVRIDLGDGGDLCALSSMQTPQLKIRTAGGVDTINLANDVTIGRDVVYQPGNDGPTLTINGAVDGSVKSTGGHGGLIFGDATIGRDVRFTSPAGDCAITVGSGTTINGNMKVSLGLGVNGLYFQSDTNPVHVLGRVTLRSGNDQDTLEFTGRVQIDGALKATLGDGASFITAQADNGFSPVLAGLSLSSGVGPQTFTFWQNATAGPITLKDTEGENTVTIEQATVNGNVRITNGPGRDVLSFNADIHGDVSVANGVGDGGVRTQTNVAGAIDGRLIVTGKDFEDRVAVLTGTTIGRDVSIDTGAGDSLVAVNGSALGGRLTVKSAGGADTFNLKTASTVAGRVSVRLGDGANVIDILDATVGALDLRTGAGVDSIDVDNMAATGATRLASGDGNDTIRIEQADLGGVTTSAFTGPFSLSAGQGNDTVAIGVVGQAYNRGVFNASASLRGDDGNDALAYLGANTFVVPAAVDFETVT